MLPYNRHFLGFSTKICTWIPQRFETTTIWSCHQSCVFKEATAKYEFRTYLDLEHAVFNSAIITYAEFSVEYAYEM